MSHLRPLRDELFKYRKRKKRSIDGTTPGVPYQRYRRFTTIQPGNRPSRSGHRQQEDYLGDIPIRYRPNMFSSAVNWSDYQPDHDDFTHSLRTPQPHHPLDSSLPENPMPVASLDELSITEQFLMKMGVRPRPQEESIPVEFEEIRHLLDGVRVPLHSLGSNVESGSRQAIPLTDGIQGRIHVPENEQNHLLPDLEHITEALDILQDRLPEDHPDIMNLKQAHKQLAWKQIEEIKQDPFFLEHYENPDDDWQSNLGSGNPYENDDLTEHQLIETDEEYIHLASIQDRELVEETELLPDYEESVVQDFQQQFFADETTDQPMAEETLVPEPMLEEVVEHGFEQLQFEAGEVEMAGPEAAYGPTMEIDNAGQPEQPMGFEVFGIDTAFDEINQAMDQMKDQGEQQNQMQDSWQQMNDPYQQMFDMMGMQMQYMANPFQMPGPMGPGYGPMPGPMMGPML